METLIGVILITAALPLFFVIAWAVVTAVFIPVAIVAGMLYDLIFHPRRTARWFVWFIEDLCEAVGMQAIRVLQRLGL